MSAPVLIKCLRANGRSVHSFVDAQGENGWALPSGGEPGAWKGPVEGVLRPHHNGLHLAKEDCLIDWLTGHHYVAETEGETVEGMDCVVARKARLVRELPVDSAGVRDFCEKQLMLLPAMMEALAVYPRMSVDVRDCVEAVCEAGVQNTHVTLGALRAFDYIKMNEMRLAYDALHSIEYNHCTKTSRACLGVLTGAFNIAARDNADISLAKFVSHKVAGALDSLHQNYHFMRDLNARGYDHGDEVRAMEEFLRVQGLLSGADTTASVTGFFATVRKRQNREILPALGL